MVDCEFSGDRGKKIEGGFSLWLLLPWYFYINSEFVVVMVFLER